MKILTVFNLRNYTLYFARKFMENYLILKYMILMFLQYSRLKF